MKTKFELFVCCLGNGITLCNKAVIENRDYKMIGHISTGGNIKLYINKGYIPHKDMKRIENLAIKEKLKFKNEFEKLPESKQYETIIESLPINKFLEIIADKRKISEQLPEIRDYYYSIV